MTRTTDNAMGTAIPVRQRTRGVSLITAIFLVVVLAGLAAGMLRLLSSQQVALGLDATGVRADQAARSGLEWGLFQQLRVPANQVTCFPNSSFALPRGGALSAFTVTVSCVVPHAAGNTVGNTTNRFTITAVACNQPTAGGACPNPSANADYVQRKVQAELN